MEELRAAFREGLGLAPDYEVDGLEYRAIPEWDSVAHLQLINELESRFDIMLETDDIIDMSSFAKARQILEKYGVAVHA